MSDSTELWWSIIDKRASSAALAAFSRRSAFVRLRRRSPSGRTASGDDALTSTHDLLLPSTADIAMSIFRRRDISSSASSSAASASSHVSSRIRRGGPASIGAAESACVPSVSGPSQSPQRSYSSAVMVGAPPRTSTSRAIRVDINPSFGQMQWRRS